ncbi:MAG: helix-turn-helix domain-containing protein [Chloroflexi bacterium]|nr:helix-turn-helix domain-containing protein [Chloroflexota bacterium]
MQRSQIREMRARLELSQERFARLLGVSLQTVRRWEAGVSRPLPLISVRLQEIRQELERSTQQGGGTIMKDTRRRPERGDVEMEVAGLGGVFKGMSGLFDIVSKMVEEGSEETTRSGEVEALGGKGKAVYGLHVRLGLGGRPVIESFGNVRPTPAGPVVAEMREPMIDVFDEGQEFRVVVEVPGVEEKGIHVEVQDDILTVTAEGGDRRYQKETLLSAPVKPQVQQSYRNGILEIRLEKR